MTPDLQRLRNALGTLGPIVEQLELDLVDDPSWEQPSDTSYLNANDRANPDIMANVDAMTVTNRLISWFGRDMEGFVGLWRGSDQAPIETAPVVRLDTEGQYSIVAATIPDYLAISMPEDEFANARTTLTNAGFTVGNNPDAIWAAIEAFDDPNGYRNELYEQNRESRGMRRSDAGGDDRGDEPAEQAEPPTSPEPATSSEPATKPAEKKPTPAKKKPTPAKKKPTPAKKKPTPAKKKPTPAKKKPTPAKKKPTPAKKKPTPAKKLANKRSPKSVKAKAKKTKR